MLLYKNVNVQQLSWLVVKNYENSITTLVFEIFWEVYEKPPLYRVGGMGVLLSITMAKSFFGEKYLINTEYRHKKL